MKYKIALIVILVSLPLITFSHGTSYKVIKNAAGITAFYKDGSPISDSEVKVYLNNKKTKPIITGRTNTKGEFLFLVKKPGTYVITVDDGMGHGFTTSRKFNSKGIMKDESLGHIHLWQKILMALIFVWGMIGTALYFKGKKA